MVKPLGQNNWSHLHKVKEAMAWLSLLSLGNPPLGLASPPPTPHGEFQPLTNGSLHGANPCCPAQPSEELLQALFRPVEDLFIILTGRKH